jgi:hypothetical protein
MGIERSGIAVAGTIKEGLHKTPTTVFKPQLFDARFLLRGTAQLILHELSSVNPPGIRVRLDAVLY